MQTLTQTDLPGLPLLARGKVRDLYSVGEHLLLIATDRISAFDHVLATGIPGKGKILTQLSLFWFQLLRDVVPNHLITADISQYPEALRPYSSQLEGRSMLVKRAQMFPVECVVRGYLSGSGWKDYKATGAVCGIPLPAGMQESAKLPSRSSRRRRRVSAASTTRTSPSTKWSRASVSPPPPNSRASASTSTTAPPPTRPSVASSWPTPSSSSASPREASSSPTRSSPPTPPVTGRPTSTRPADRKPSFDKQFVRDYLEQIQWNKQAPAPALPDDIAAKTQRKYLDAYRLLTGHELDLG